MQDSQIDYRGHVLFRAIIYFGFFLLLFQLVLSGNITYYIAPKMLPFSYFLLAALLVLGIIQLVRSTSDNEEELYCDCGFSHHQTRNIFQTIAFYALFVVPILTGLWFPTVVLDSSIAAKRGLTYGTNAPTPTTSTSVGIDVEEDSSLLNMDQLVSDAQEGIYGELSANRIDELKQELLTSEKIVVDDERYNDIMLILHEDLDLFIDKEIELIGFVFKDYRTAKDEFIIARFGITCCVADAFVFGIRASSEGVEHLGDDDWVKATGVLTSYELEGWILPFIEIQDLEMIAEPENPYIYDQ